MSPVVIRKKHILNLILLSLLLSATLLSIYAVKAYKGDDASGQYRIGQLDSSQGETAPNMKQNPGGRFSQPNFTRRMAPPEGGPPNGIAKGGTKYTPQIIAYAAIFLTMAILGFFALRKIKIDPDNEKILMLTLLGVGLLLRISFATLVTGHPFDIQLFKRWAMAAAGNFSHFYSGGNISDYPPLYIYVLFIIGKVATISSLNPYFTLLLKLPSMMADIATSFLIYKLAKKYLSLEISILLAAFYAFNPAVFINSTYWGQVDSFFTLIVCSSILLLSEQRIGPASALFTAAVLMKPQGIIFLPVLFFELTRLKKFNNFPKAVLCAVGAAVVIILPFSANMNVLWIFKLFSRTAAEYRFASMNAFNFFALLGANYKNDAAILFVFSYYTWGIIFIGIVTVYSWIILIKGNSKAFVPAVALLQAAGVFTLSTRMHERYLFPAIALSMLSFIYLKDKRLLLFAAGFSSTVYVNTHFVLYETGVGINAVPFGPALIFTSLLNMFFLLYLAWVLFDLAIGKKRIRFDAGCASGRREPV